MTRQETNKLILNFMEIEPTYYDGKYRWDNSPFFYCSDTNKESVINSIANYAQYDTSWDWLMPVIEKIESLGYVVDIFKTSVSIHKEGDTMCIVDLSGNDFNEKIHAVYHAVTEFIIWYSDLINNPQLWPDPLREIIEKWGPNLIDGLSYEQVAELLKEVESVGYTFDYYLDAEPYNLRKIN